MKRPIVHIWIVMLIVCTLFSLFIFRTAMANCCPGPGCPSLPHLFPEVGVLKLNDFISSSSGIEKSTIALGKLYKYAFDQHDRRSKYLSLVNDLLRDVTWNNHTITTCIQVYSATNIAPNSTYDDLNTNNFEKLKRMWAAQHKKHPSISNYNAFLVIGTRAFANKDYHLARFCYRFAAFSSRAGQLLVRADNKIADIEYQKVCSKGDPGCDK
ncbi:MAG: hypothetical protein KAS93_01980 [Gammaproteobacteria bacterium]|nr:hypothetical protein [Gammaproteobacteria bacterium]